MSGSLGDLPVYASSSSSAGPKPALPSHLPSESSSSTRHRTANLRAAPTLYDTMEYSRHSDDYTHEQQLNGGSSRLYPEEESSAAWNGGANPYAHTQDAGLPKTPTPWGRPRIPRHHSHSSATSTSYSDDLSSSNSPFVALLAQPRRWRIPRRAQIRYELRSMVHSVQSRHVVWLLIYLIPGALFCLFLLFLIYEPQVEITLYSRRWIHEEVDPVLPLSGCFGRAEKGGVYNTTDRISHKTSTWDVQAGVDMRKGMDCYDYAGMVGSYHDWQEPQDDPAPLPIEERTVYHTYWRTDLVPFGPRQAYMLKSFFATQPLHTSRLILWSNGDLEGNAIIRDYIRRFPESFTLKRVDMRSLARGTALEGSDKLGHQDKRAWVDGDLLRLLVLWNMGGVWVDMDSLLTRSLEPLLEHEFVTQWDCYNKPYTPLNGALMHFHAQSPYLCEAFHIMATSSTPRPGSTDWGSLLYIKLWRRLVRAGVPPFKVLPWCFSDGRSCRIDNRLPDPFRNDGEGQGRWIPGPRSSSGDSNASTAGGRIMGMEEGGLLDEVLHKVFSVHLHNQWEKNFPEGGWVDRLLLRRYDKELQSMLFSSLSKFSSEFDKRAPETEGQGKEEPSVENEVERSSER